jgi:small-conductance mechanosensitive channel
VFDEILQNFLVLVFLIQGAFWSNAILDCILIDWAGKKFATDPGVATALGSVGFLLRLAVWVIFLMLTLGNMGLDVGPLIASLGIGGIAFALALQNVLGDLLGRVQNVGLKTTRLEALSGETLVLSNSDLLSSRIRNFEKRAKRRTSFLLSVTYSTPLDKLEKIPSIVKGIIEGQKQTQYERSFLKKLGDRGIDFEVVYSMRGPNLADFGTVNHNINMEILRKFDIEGIGFAYRTQTIDVPNSG